MLTDYTAIVNGKFKLELVDAHGVHLDQIRYVELAIVQPFIDIVNNSNFGGHESFLVGHRTNDGKLFIIGKTVKLVDDKILVNHYNHYPERKYIALTHNTFVDLVKQAKLFTSFYDALFRVRSEDVRTTISTLKRLYDTLETEVK